MSVFASEFTNEAGDAAADPLLLAGSRPVVELSELALLLSPPALFGEFIPRSLWRGVKRAPLRLPPPAAGDLSAAFTCAVDDLTAAAEIIGVKVSGGLDSLAVLIHATEVAGGRKVMAFTTEMTDDSGRSSAAVVQRLLNDLGLPAELVVLNPHRDRTAPLWSAAGPRLDAMPEVNAATAHRAAELGVDVLLSGDGADELLGVPRYATWTVGRRSGLGAGARYFADVTQAGAGWASEAAAFLAGVLPSRARAQAYWATNWPTLCFPEASALLAEPYRESASAWAREWVGDRIAAHARSSRSWAQSDALDALLPREVLLQAGPVAEGSPYLHGRFLATALALPVGDRYRADLLSPYLRCKAQVVQLIPAWALPALPRRKQYFSAELARYAAADEPTAPLSVAAGILDPQVLADETDTALLLSVAAVERWLAGAREAGASW